MATIAQQIQELYIGLLGRAGEKAGVDYWTDQINRNNITIEGVRENTVKFQPEYQQGLGSLSRGDALNVLYNRLFQRPPEEAGFLYWVQGGGKDVPFDKLILALSNGAQAEDRATLDNKSEAAQFYTDNVPVDKYTPESSTSAVNTVNNIKATVDASKARTLDLIDSKTLVLTPSDDPLVGSEKGDTFIGFASDTGAASDTFNQGDALDGRSGDDTLNLTVSGTSNDSTLAAANVQNIETINLKAQLADSSANTTLNAANFTGATAFYADHATSKVTFTGLDNSHAVGVKSHSNLGGINLAINYVNDATNSVINLKGGSSAIVQSGAGITTTTINSTGQSTNVLASLALSGSAEHTLNINADAHLNIGSITGLTGGNARVNISGTQAVGVGFEKLDSNVKVLDGSGFTTGRIAVGLFDNAGIDFTGGGGNDYVFIDSTPNSVNAGGGAEDLIIFANVNHIATAELGAKYTNFEYLINRSADTINMDYISGITKLFAYANNSDSFGFSNLTAAQASAIQVVEADGRMNFSIKGAANAGQIDSLTLTFDDENGQIGEDIQEQESVISADDIEIFNFHALDNVRLASSELMDDWSTINVTGIGEFSLTTGSFAVQENAVITSTTTGTVIVDVKDSYANGIAITTGSGHDNLLMSKYDFPDVINTGSGDDIIQANGASWNDDPDIITTGSGFDTVYLSLNSALGVNLEIIDTITDLDLGEGASAVDKLVFRTIDITAGEVVNLDAQMQADISSRSNLVDAIERLLETSVSAKGDTTLFGYDNEQYILVNCDGNAVYDGGFEILVKVTGVSGTLDDGDISFISGLE